MSAGAVVNACWTGYGPEPMRSFSTYPVLVRWQTPQPGPPTGDGDTLRPERWPILAPPARFLGVADQPPLLGKLQPSTHVFDLTRLVKAGRWQTSSGQRPMHSSHQTSHEPPLHEKRESRLNFTQRSSHRQFTRDRNVPIRPFLGVARACECLRISRVAKS